MRVLGGFWAKVLSEFFFAFRKFFSLLDWGWGWSWSWGAQAGARLGMGPGLGLGAGRLFGAGAGGPGGCWRALDWDIQNDTTTLDEFA